MRIGVVSDTHGHSSSLQRVIAAAGPVDQWLHAGDYFYDGRQLAELTGLPVTGVAGNCDRTRVVPIDEYVEAAGQTIWITHGHRYDVKYGMDQLLFWGREYGASVIVFGHTHVPYNCSHDGILLLNPGSPSSPRGGSAPSFGILEISPGRAPSGYIIEL